MFTNILKIFKIFFKYFKIFLNNVKKIFQKSVLKILHDKKIILMGKKVNFSGLI